MVSRRDATTDRWWIIEGVSVLVVQRRQGMVLTVATDQQADRPCGLPAMRRGTWVWDCRRTPAFAVYLVQGTDAEVLLCAVHARAAGWLRYPLARVRAAHAIGRRRV